MWLNGPLPENSEGFDEARISHNETFEEFPDRNKEELQVSKDFTFDEWNLLKKLPSIHILIVLCAVIIRFFMPIAVFI